MTGARLILRRAAAQRGTMVTLLILIGAIAAILAGSVGYTRAATVATVHATLEDVPAAGVQVQTRLADDPAAQDDAVHATTDRLLGVAEPHVFRTLRTEPATATTDRDETRVVLGLLPDAEHVEVTAAEGDSGGSSAADGSAADEAPAADDGPAIVVTGELPGDGEVLAPQSAAEELGLTPGSEIVLRDATLSIVGTWRAVDPEARPWFADPAIVGGADAEPLLLTDDATLTGVDNAPFVRWTILPEPTALTAADLPGLAAGLDGLDFALGDDDAVAVRGLTVEGTLAQTVEELRQSTSTASAVGLVPVALLAIISLIATVQVVRLLGHTRARETEILVARGAAPRQLTGWSAAELAVVAVVGAAAGTGAALVVVARLDGGAAQTSLMVLIGAVVAVVAVVTGTAAAGLQARAMARRLVTDRSGRLQDATALGAVVLVTAAAALAAWQLLRHGTPLIVGDDGSTQVDPLAVVSLGAVLAALAMLALALLGPLTRAVAAVRVRSRSLPGVLAARQVSRRVRAYAVPVVLVVLAAAAATSASSFAGASLAQRDQVAALATGSDVRVTVPVGAASRLAEPQSVPSAPYSEIAGVQTASVVLRGAGTFGELPVAVSAVDTTRITDIMPMAERLDLGPATSGLAPDTDGGVALPPGTGTLELTVLAHAGPTGEALALEQTSFAESRESLVAQGFTEEEAEQHMAAEEERHRRDGVELRTRVWLVDGDGAPSMLEAGTVTSPPGGGGDAAPDAGPAEYTLSAELPGDGEYRVVGIDVDLARPELTSTLSYEVRAMAADGEDVRLGDDSWVPVEDPQSTDLEATGTIGRSGTVEYDWQAPAGMTLRLVPEEPPATLPVAISEHLARAADLDVGGGATIHVRGATLDLTVDAVVPAVPGGLDADAVLVDQAALTSYLLGVQESVLLSGDVWLRLTPEADAADVAAAAREVAGPQAVIEVAGQSVTDSAASVRSTFWIASAGAAVLALVGVAAVMLALTRERRSEVMVLRALGLPPAAQARSRILELLGTGVLAVVLGVVAGLLTSSLLVPTLARAAATQTSPLPLTSHLDLLPALVLLGFLAAGLVVVAVVVGTRVRSQALDAEYREEVR